MINYTAWIPAELGITHRCLRCVAKHLYNKLKPRHKFQDRSSPQSLQGENLLQESKMSSTVLFHEHLAAATGKRFSFSSILFLYIKLCPWPSLAWTFSGIQLSVWEVNSTHSNALKSISWLELRVISNEEKAYYKLPKEFFEVQALLTAATNTGSLQLWNG